VYIRKKLSLWLGSHNQTTNYPRATDCDLVQGMGFVPGFLCSPSDLRIVETTPWDRGAQIPGTRSPCR